jgi:hypothetical protein
MAARAPNPFTFQIALDEGDYYRALGVPSDARRLDIDAAAARLVRRMPDKAHAISAVARMLTRRDAKAVYQSLCRLQAAVLRQLSTQYGPDCVDSFHDCRRLSWRKCCDLFHFNLNDTNLSIGPRGARSLAAEGRRWIVDSIRFDVSHPPSYLEEFYTKQQQGNDVTLARTRYSAKRKPVLAMAATALVLPACLLLGFVMASVDDGKMGRPSSGQRMRRPAATRPATPSFNDVMRKTAAIEFKLQLATMAAAKHPSDAKLQQMIAGCYLDLADVYSTSPVTRIRATEFRQKALEIVEGVVADNPNVSRLYGNNVLPDDDDIFSAGEVSSVISTQRQHD